MGILSRTSRFARHPSSQSSSFSRLQPAVSSTYLCAKPRKNASTKTVCSIRFSVTLSTAQVSAFYDKNVLRGETENVEGASEKGRRSEREREIAEIAAGNFWMRGDSVAATTNPALKLRAHEERSLGTGTRQRFDTSNASSYLRLVNRFSFVSPQNIPRCNQFDIEIKFIIICQPFIDSVWRYLRFQNRFR